MNEVNVKELRFVEGAGVLVKKVKCNFRTMGKKFGKLMKGVAAAMDQLSQEQIAQLEQQGSIGIEVEGQQLTVEAVDVEIISEDIPGWLVANEGNLTVALEVELTERISVVLAPNAEVEKSVSSFGDYIMTQVLADTIEIQPNDGQEVDFDDFKLNIKINKQ